MFSYSDLHEEVASISVWQTKYHCAQDHQPLETIFKKPLGNALRRVQRMMLQLQQYSFKVMNKRRKELYMADMLSRAPLEKAGSVNLETEVVF